ncbi:tyrosine-protein phosphatase non-receptor type substrate 1 [Willisornis vidua]|uniref:Tyrosine-protein phosphatase non-receptor type substrate 1 n=1 Tax=Willisornis vidua TaxID=1566151 RepID=A0ABQ9DXC0_9PASS|nr:tyrosine-protein phosphatase non-receptor type substrate 1 [Willisornis vidua]
MGFHDNDLQSTKNLERMQKKTKQAEENRDDITPPLARLLTPPKPWWYHQGETKVFSRITPWAVVDGLTEVGGLMVDVLTLVGGLTVVDILMVDDLMVDKNPITSQMPQVTEWQRQSYNMSSSVTVVLGEGDVLSQLTCEVQHSASPTLLRGTYQLSGVLRVSPSVDVRAEQTSPIQLNKTVNFTCHVKGFYPPDVSVSWLENGMKMEVEKNNSRLSLSSKGLFELRSWVEVQATEEKNGSVFTCLVVHDAQAPVNYSTTLWIASPDEEGLRKKFQMDNENLVIYSVVAVVCLILALLVAAILYLIRTKQIKGKSSPSARLHEPEKSSEATTQESDPNNLTYADLNFDKERKTIRRMVEMSQQSEYACIQTSQAPNGDENLTYADLDMVHLSKAPKRPAPRPEEATSEYASVQIPRK